MNNIAFSRVLKIDGRLWEFNFRKLPGDSNDYHTDFTDARGNRVQFIVYKDEQNQWQAKGAFIAEWILNDVQLLGNAIEENSLIAL
jgi:hypothetical protein